MDSKLRQRKIDHQLEIIELKQQAKQKYGFGYLPEQVDINDYTRGVLKNPQRFDDPEKKEIAEILTNIVELDKVNPNYEDDVIDFSEKFPDVRNQGSLGSCTNFMSDGIIGYNRKTQYNKIVQTSPIFGYKKTRDIMGLTSVSRTPVLGDTGASIRDTIKALVTFGYILEEHYPYNIKDFDKPIPDDLEKMGQLNQAISYIRIDEPNQTRIELLEELKRYMIKEIPIGFGFAVYQSIDDAYRDGKIPFPSRNDIMIGGHAIVLCGYDNQMIIQNNSGIRTKGAFKIRNSWGKGWGENGYGWLPYQYIISELAMDFWAVLELEWLNWHDFS